MTSFCVHISVCIFMRICFTSEIFLNINKCTGALKSFQLALLTHNSTAFQSHRTRERLMVNIKRKKVFYVIKTEFSASQFSTIDFCMVNDMTKWDIWEASSSFSRKPPQQPLPLPKPCCANQLSLTVLVLFWVLQMNFVLSHTNPHDF